MAGVQADEFKITESGLSLTIHAADAQIEKKYINDEQINIENQYNMLCALALIQMIIVDAHLVFGAGYGLGCIITSTCY